ncbi:MAG: ribose-phosphate pyrophosphokinase [Aquabacterium sp.]|uniref:ribose-phosphate pyrophosphokinase n=1 Tax=Aquabacterium sp. TaxID=1872578 RepID=UPI0025C05652|nr:ribose-phosphate pyrophosphokinase [Aquabacterium sp.]MBI5927647.1 ribose-phosphate pyrophosphokinase [Aquabacterium sp.]
MSALLLYFADEQAAAERLAQACGVPAACVESHRFPDDELRLRLPLDSQGLLPSNVIVYRSLNRPNDKLVELLLVAAQARDLGARHLTLVAPYLAYMRQDIAFHPGEIVSQKVVGRFLAERFDAVITVDPHLHRIATLQEAIPIESAISLSGAPILAQLIAQHLERPLLVGPDAESAQWIEAAARAHHFDHGVCTKERRGDKDVEITLPEIDVRGRTVVLLDDIASSGRTIAAATQRLLQAGARSVDVAVTHALFAGDALQVIKASGVGRIWSTDCIAHDSNAIHMAPLLAQALQPLLKGGST